MLSVEAVGLELEQMLSEHTCFANSVLPNLDWGVGVCTGQYEMFRPRADVSSRRMNTLWLKKTIPVVLTPHGMPQLPRSYSRKPKSWKCELSTRNKAKSKYDD